uniref:Kinesin-like protein n=1 Tax=Kalanchoe fedtschenkoi TaxID=63787 RepID=A0A7N0T8I5_KALFE
MSLAVGRRRSTTVAHHQRQYSDNFLESSTNTNRWLQNSPIEEFGTRLGRNVQQLRSGVNAGSELDSDPSTPLMGCRPTSLKLLAGDGVSPCELSPGLLDLNSLDTELLPEQAFRTESLYESEAFLPTNKLMRKPRGMPENNLLRSFSAERERANNVAKIKVVVRKRPLNRKEATKNEEDIVTIEPGSNFLTVHETKFKVDLTEYEENHDFVFDAVLNENVSNEEVYSETVEPIVPLIFQRTKATCFAYGQTGSGKTYTMQPLPLKASEDILRLIHFDFRNQGFQLFVSFFEIYGGKLFDLLNDRRKLCMREDGKQQVCIVGLQEFRVSSVETVKELIERGSATRSTGTTGANEESSRSHAILQLVIKKSVDFSETKPARPVGKLSFIDLAGSERGADTTDNDKQTRMEGAEINKSLLALKECIRALDNDQGHIPFRGSKLTEVLRDSFVGDSRTVMISCISPSSGSCEHTLNTLRYADRVKSLSKANSSKKDVLSLYSSVRDSSPSPFSSASVTQTVSEDSGTIGPIGNNRFGWQKHAKKETSPSDCMETYPKLKAERNVAAPLLSSSQKPQPSSFRNNAECDAGYEEAYEQKMPAWVTKTSEKASDVNKWTNERHPSDFRTKPTHADDDLDALLKDEEDLVNAHRKQVEDTIAIVREEMDLLALADKPGNQLDTYISSLNAILTQKAAGISLLQTRLASFQRRLSDYSVLSSAP